MLWLDGKDTATMFNATSGGSTPSVGSPILRWQDKSGSGNHVTEATVPPTRLSGGGAAFDGTMKMSTASIASATTVFTSFVVVKLTGTTTSTFHQFWSRNNVRNHYAEYGALQQMRAALNANNIARSSSNTIALNTTYLTTAKWDGGSTGANLTLRLQGNPDNGATTGSATVTSDANTSILIGQRPAADRGLKGELCEVLIFTRVLTDVEVEQIETYLSAKWGMTAPDFSSSSSSSPSSNSSSSSSSSNSSSSSSNSSSSSIDSSSSSSSSPSSASSNSSSSSSSVLPPNTLRENTTMSAAVSGTYIADIKSTSVVDNAALAASVTGTYA